MLSGGAIPAVNGVFYTDVSVRVLLVAAGAAYVVLTVVFRAAARHGVAGELLRMRVCVGGRDVELTALRDTGNGLRDPVGGTPVLVAAPGALDGVLPRRVRQLLEMSLPPADLLEPLRQIAPELRFRLIPYHAVGAGGLLLAVRSDWIEWAGRRQAGVLVALSPTELGTGYAALWSGDADGGRRDHGRVQTETERFAGTAGAAAGGGRALHRGQRHAAAAAEQGAGEGTAGTCGGGVCPAGADRHNLRLVVYIARRFENTGVGIEDLISIGTIGLIKAVGTYRSDKNIKLATYASRCIENEILMYLRKNAARKGEVSFDEPLNTDWDGNELLLSDVLGTEADMVMRPIEEDVDRSLSSARGGEYPLSPGKADHHPALWPGRQPGADAKGSGGSAGDLPVVHLPAGKAHHFPAEKGNFAPELTLTSARGYIILKRYIGTAKKGSSTGRREAKRGNGGWKFP